MRNSSFVACMDPRYASTGTLSHPVALPLRKALRQILSSSSLRASSAEAEFSRFLSASAAGR